MCACVHVYTLCVCAYNVFVRAYVFACMCEEGRLRALGPDYKGAEKTGARTDVGSRESFLHQRRELMKEAFRRLPRQWDPEHETLQAQETLAQGRVISLGHEVRGLLTICRWTWSLFPRA